MKFGKIPKEKRKFICDKLISEPYLSRTCSVHSSVKSTSTRRKYGFGTEQVYPWYGPDKYFFVVLSYESENKPVNLHRLIKYITKYQP